MIRFSARTYVSSNGRRPNSFKKSECSTSPSRYVRSLLQWPSPGDSPEFSRLVGVGTLLYLQIAETAAHLHGVLKCLDHPATSQRHLMRVVMIWQLTTYSIIALFDSLKVRSYNYISGLKVWTAERLARPLHRNRSFAISG